MLEGGVVLYETIGIRFVVFLRGLQLLDLVVNAIGGPWSDASGGPSTEGKKQILQKVNECCENASSAMLWAGSGLA